ncbi:MAG: hypothetical protein ACUVQG_13150 [Thermogutta sp.]
MKLARFVSGKILWVSVFIIEVAFPSLWGQEMDFRAVRVDVDFSRKLQTWDGFGFNYVETCQTRDYAQDPQDYGGLSILDEASKQQIIEMIFGKDGLKVALVKMFLDPFHQDRANGPYDHHSSTQNMRWFVQQGLRTTRGWGGDLTIITTLYGPPAYMTKQKVLRGRDLDPAYKKDLARYLVDWVKFLRVEEGLPVKYVSLHNEGEDWFRWNQAGLTDYQGHDYNLFWPPEQVAEFIKLVSQELKAAGLPDVGVTPGETSNWYRFDHWGYADALLDDGDALQALSLITSHGFYSGGFGRWFGEHRSAGIDKLRAARPDLHAWVTSTSWGQMNAKMAKEFHGNIYTAKVNAIIPWAGIQRPTKWIGGDPNPGCAFKVNEDGTYEVQRGYWIYKQLARAGQPGMAVARANAMDSEIAVIAFASNGTRNPDAFVVINIGKQKLLKIRVKGTAAKTFQAFRTGDDGKECYAPFGRVACDADTLVYESPGFCVTTFFAE